MKKYFFALFFVYLLSANYAFSAPHSQGTNVVGPDGTVYWLKLVDPLPPPPCFGMPGCEYPTPPAPQLTKFPYPNAAAFLSYGFNSWDKVLPATAEDLALPSGYLLAPALGSLIQQQGSPTVYLITTGGRKSAFTSYQIFLELGYKPANISTADISYLRDDIDTPLIVSSAMAHTATVINQDGIAYLMSRVVKYGIANERIFKSWGFLWEKVVPANSFDRQVGQADTFGLFERRPGELNPF